MMQFRFTSIVRKYFKPYDLLRPGNGGAYEHGKYIPAPSERVTLRGNVQPISARLKASEGGDYTETDRMLFTPTTHDVGDIIEYKGIQYRTVETDERDYSDINQYVLRKVVASDPIRTD